jgi:hypothetical protein
VRLTTLFIAGGAAIAALSVPAVAGGGATAKDALYGGTAIASGS